MIWMLNRKRLIALSDALELARIRTKLEAAEIPMEVKTTTSRGPLGRSVDVGFASAPRNVNSPVSSRGVYGAELTHIYYVYVRRKDYAAAKRAIQA